MIGRGFSLFGGEGRIRVLGRELLVWRRGKLGRGEYGDCEFLEMFVFIFVILLVVLFLGKGRYIFLFFDFDSGRGKMGLVRSVFRVGGELVDY